MNRREFLKTASAVGAATLVAMPTPMVEANPPNVFVPVRTTDGMLTELAQCRVCGDIASIDQFFYDKIPGGHPKDQCPWA